MTDRRMHVVKASEHGQSNYLLLLDGKHFATVRDRLFSRSLFFISPYMEINPPPAGRCWRLPLQELMVATADVRTRLRLRTGAEHYTIGDPRLVDRRIILTICLGDDADAVIHKHGNREQVGFPSKDARQENWRMSLHEAESALCEGLRSLYDVERWTIADAIRADFTIVPTNSKVDALIIGNKWTEAKWHGTEMCLRIFERSDFRPWNLPYDTVVTVLAQMRSQLSTSKVQNISQRNAGHTSQQAISLYEMASPYREWVTIGIDTASGNGKSFWAELHQEGPELQLTIYPRGDGRCWELPLTHALDRLHMAKELLIGDAERPAVRRPVVVCLGCHSGTFVADDAEDAIVDIEPVARGFAVRHGGREFATVVRGSPPLLEVKARPNGRGWTLPLAGAMDILDEARVQLGLDEDGAGHLRHVVVCTEAGKEEAVVEVRFDNGLRAEMQRCGDDMLVHVGGGDGTAPTRKLPLSEVLATFRWGLAVLHAAGPRSPTEARFGDFSVIARSDGADVLVAGERWVAVTVDNGEPRMELFGRKDLRPWRLPCDAVVDVLTDVRRRLSGDGDDLPGKVAFSGRESLSGRKGALDHWLAIPSDRESGVVIFRFRDEDCWVQWAELNEGGPESQLEMFGWPGRPMSGVPLREVVDRLRHGRTLLVDHGG